MAETIEADRAVGTIGRRVNQLEEDDYLQSTAIKPSDSLYTLLQGYYPTEKGQEALKEETEGDANGS